MQDGAQGWICREVRAQTHCVAREKLGGMKASKSVDFIAALPRSPVGKALKKIARAPCWARRERTI